MKRRNLSGIFIFDQFPGEKKKSPTCFEDCQHETKIKFLETLNDEGIINLLEMLGETKTEIIHASSKETIIEIVKNLAIYEAETINKLATKFNIYKPDK